MKNIQVIDGADNSAYSIYAVSEDDFCKIFPADEQDVEFINDFVERVGEKIADEICSRIWNNEVDKKKIKGIHGTLFYELEFKKKYYPNRKEKDMVVSLN